MGIFVAVIVAVGLGAGVLALMDGQIPVDGFLVVAGLFLLGLVSVIGGIFSRDHNKDRDINGEIETKLQNFSNQIARLHWQARSGCDVSDKIAAIDAEEKIFRAHIEYGQVTDGAENYYSYKKGEK